MSRLEKRLLNTVVRASREFHLIEPGDRVMACLSGGKDSYVMLHLLRAMQRKANFDFSIIAVNLDQKQPGFPEHVLPTWLEENGYDYRIVERNTYDVVTKKIPEGKTYCPLCSRLRRGILYDTAVELGATKIALGHHRDDVIETLLLNIFYSGQLKAMPPRLHSDDGRNVVIRPLVFCAEEEIAAFAEEMQFPIIPCNLCGSQDNLHRQKVKDLIATLQSENNCVKGNLLSSLTNVKVSHLLDAELWQRVGLDLPVGDGLAEDLVAPPPKQGADGEEPLFRILN
ncbi:MAG: tRNA 2-thiocytidine(32) synthetase TtcA [Deltaproteobacteria bacterium]|nr:tRNA 2-thiocytidine(32) synthetase TtcA [Deltaproteobacteria bacterium]